MTDIKELKEQFAEAIQLYIEKTIENSKNIKEAVEALRTHSTLPCGVGGYIDANDINDYGEFNGEYAILKYADIEYICDVNDLTIRYPAGQLPQGIDLMAWIIEVKKRLNGDFDEKSSTKQENFYVDSQMTGVVIDTKYKIQYKDSPEIKTKADILDNLLGRSEVVIKK